MADEYLTGAIATISDAAIALGNIDRSKDYMFWRQEAAPRLSNDLMQLPPFEEYGNLWIHTGDGGGAIATPSLGGWVIDRLLDKMTPADIVRAFVAESKRNVGYYSDVTPLYGVHIDQYCDLGNGITLEPDPAETFPALLQISFLQPHPIAVNTALLVQAFTVTPAFVAVEKGATPEACPSDTQPDAQLRDAVRKQVRLACLLASAGPVEIPSTRLLPDRKSVLVAGQGNAMDRMFATRPMVNFPVNAPSIRNILALLQAFQGLDSLMRSIERLGRSRVATSAVDRVLELGIAAEIALMHDDSSSNTEISHKLSGRAAWLLGTNPAEREAIFRGMKKLYNARSKAVHSGQLPSNSAIDLNEADELVRRVILALLNRGHFPNWLALTLGSH